MSWSKGSQAKESKSKISKVKVAKVQTVSVPKQTVQSKMQSKKAGPKRPWDYVPRGQSQMKPCSRYETKYFCNLLAQAGWAQCMTFTIIHLLEFIGRKLCRNAVSIHSSDSKPKCLRQISYWYSEIIKYNCCSRYGTNYFCNLLAQCASFAIIHSLGFIGRKLCRNAVPIHTTEPKSNLCHRFHAGFQK